MDEKEMTECHLCGIFFPYADTDLCGLEKKLPFWSFVQYSSSPKIFKVKNKQTKNKFAAHISQF